MIDWLIDLLFQRMWELEFECLEADGPVHNRVYSYSLTVGPPGSDDVIVTAGIAKVIKNLNCQNFQAFSRIFYKNNGPKIIIYY